MSDSQPNSNKVLIADPRFSTNFFESDLLLQAWLNHYLPVAHLSYLKPLMTRLGAQAATQMDMLSLDADQSGPQLRKRDRWGITVDEIKFHPAYWELMQVAVDSEMMRLKWEPSLRERFSGQRHKMGFALGLLFAMSESGQYCPLCMTDGVAHLIDQFCEPADQKRLMPHIYSLHLEEFFTGAMFLTEKSGGSDVGANLTEARPLPDGRYTLHGEKWFCSNVNAQIIFVLARTQSSVKGTRGLSIFLVERQLPDGSRNAIDIVRLKDKLGTRSMASGECLLDGTIGTLVGPEFQGFRVMTEMINLSRMYNSVAAIAAARRAMVEAWQFLGHRQTFGKIALSHALVRAKFWELGSLYHANFLLVWRAIAAMDSAEGGAKAEAELLRMLTPMAKRSSAELAVYLCRESMELMGGMGYIEESVIPKMMRDAMVLPIWEGAGNIMVLDMLRASAKSDGLGILFAEIEKICSLDHPAAGMIQGRARELAGKIDPLKAMPQDAMEFQAKTLFLQLTTCYQAALVLEDMGLPGRAGGQLALDWLLASMQLAELPMEPPQAEAISSLIAWRA